jgi:hypothetical protein
MFLIDKDKNSGKVRIHPALVLCPSCIPEKVGVNQKSINKNLRLHQK